MLKNPYSIRCLKAIEDLAGGRVELAQKLGVSRHTIDRWVIAGQVPRAHILPLIEISGKKFNAEELLGGLDTRNKNRVSGDSCSQ